MQWCDTNVDARTAVASMQNNGTVCASALMSRFQSKIVRTYCTMKLGRFFSCNHKNVIFMSESNKESQLTCFFLCITQATWISWRLLGLNENVSSSLAKLVAIKFSRNCGYFLAGYDRLALRIFSLKLSGGCTVQYLSWTQPYRYVPPVLYVTKPNQK